MLFSTHHHDYLTIVITSYDLKILWQSVFFLPVEIFSVAHSIPFLFHSFAISPVCCQFRIPLCLSFTTSFFLQFDTVFRLNSFISNRNKGVYFSYVYILKLTPQNCLDSSVCITLYFIQYG